MRAYIFSSFLLLFFCFSLSAEGQFLKKVGKKIKKEVKHRVDKNTDKAVDKSIDKVEGGIKNAVNCGVGDAACISKAQKEGNPVTVVNDKGQVVQEIPSGGGSKVAEKEMEGIGEVGENYDFKPGERTLFANDFSEDVIGNFPRKLKFMGGTLSVVSLSSGRALEVKTKGAFTIDLPEKLPERFTVEFNEYNSDFVNDFRVELLDEEGKPKGSHYIKVDGYGSHGSGIASYDRSGFSSLKGSSVINKRMVPIEVMVDGSYVKMYIDKIRVANIPSADLGRSNTIRFKFTDVRSKPIYIAGIRIAAGGRSLYQTIEDEGRVAINDIHFETGSAEIKPVSEDELKKIADLLNQHTELQLLIEGHTDNTGTYETNKKLSKDRAAAIKTYLINHHAISAGRLKTEGFGATQPVASNDNDEGRAKNRRVELVKI